MSPHQPEIDELLDLICISYRSDSFIVENIRQLKLTIRECLEGGGLVNLTYCNKGYPKLNFTYRKVVPDSDNQKPDLNAPRPVVR